MRKSIMTLINHNWQSGLTIGLLSIPFSVSLAVASQTTPTVGIITAIWAGLIGALFGGSHFNIIGTTGALSGLLAGYALAHGAQSLAMLALIAGLFILIGWAIHIERYLVFIPASTMHGFTLGIAFIIALSQLNAALGLNDLSVHKHLIANVIESLKHIHATSLPIFALFSIFLIALIFLTRWRPLIPWVIILTPLGILIGYYAQLGIFPFMPTLGTKFGTICPKLFQAPTFFWDFSLLSVGLVVALIAIIETMVSARIADGLTKTHHHKRKEMIGLGLANIASGICGGIPATAAIGRTILNIKTGATHKISAIICCLVIAFISFILLPYFTFAPLAVIAAILVHTATRLIASEHFVRMYHIDRKNFWVSLLVAGITVAIDPIMGILIGSTLSLIFFADAISRGQFSLAKHRIRQHRAQTDTTHEILVYVFKGQLVYINSQAHIARFEYDVNSYTTAILQLDDVYFMDLDGVEALSEIIMILHNHQKNVLIVNNNLLLEPMLNESKEYQQLVKQQCVFSSIQEALDSQQINH